MGESESCICEDEKSAKERELISIHVVIHCPFRLKENQTFALISSSLVEFSFLFKVYACAISVETNYDINRNDSSCKVLPTMTVQKPSGRAFPPCFSRAALCFCDSTPH